MTNKPKAERVPAPTLADVQAQMQAAILSGDDRVLGALANGAREGRETLLGVYRHGYMARLVEVVGNEYPLLRDYIGHSDFGDLARAYIAASPSRSPNARWVGISFPEFLAQHWAVRGKRILREIAKIERAVSDAFDSADVPVISAADLAAFDPASWGQLKFVAHPSARLLVCETNAFDIWKALKDAMPVPGVEANAGTKHVFVWRQRAMPKVRVLSYEEAMMWQEAVRGATFGALCELAALYDEPDAAPMRAAQYLKGWLESEVLTQASLAARSEAARKPSELPVA